MLRKRQQRLLCKNNLEIKIQIFVVQLITYIQNSTSRIAKKLKKLNLKTNKIK